ncbi:TIGR00730 family Rossman fold protein [Pontiella agarivorans]|uniref:Cytokinin riboside 5'-monophosphate phosphoribohydrolase n=1 Tax=Pontiella agarivorans TaxID=3038953 RepID=A0ABU5MZD7_9BACT|nr:TIGR00730 family Rossman fold protein [Pontiella agarivorans]MDZ8119556.1 TIGR00730 family Rossman fold protein [Pontiella agarivorans]
MIAPPKAYENISFLNSPYCRPVRLQLEYLHPEVTMQEQGVKSTIVLFGSARIPSPETADECKNQNLAGLVSYYEEARKLSHLISTTSQNNHDCEYVIVTGGGGGIMEAGNRGADEANCKSISLNIQLPFEQEANPYVTPELNFEFHYFHMRKMHFLQRAKAVVIFPGGFGTFDELFEALTLIQTKKIDRMPVILFDSKHWKKLVNWEYLAACGLISPEDLEIITFCDKAEEAWNVITTFYE